MDWKWLCRKCHMETDGRMEKIVKRNKQIVRAKLNYEKAQRIRKEYADGGILQTELASKYGVGIGVINSIINWHSWRGEVKA